MIKVLGFMGLSYEILISPKEDNQILRNTLYKEDSNILAYFVIKAIIMSNYKDFLIWCNTNNTSLLQFKSTQKNQLLFCDFIKKHSNTKVVFEGGFLKVLCGERLIKIFKFYFRSKRSRFITFDHADIKSARNLSLESSQA
jgi:hypothetical protein